MGRGLRECLCVDKCMYLCTRVCVWGVCVYQSLGEHVRVFTGASVYGVEV